MIRPKDSLREDGNGIFLSKDLKRMRMRITLTRTIEGMFSMTKVYIHNSSNNIKHIFDIFSNQVL